MGCRAGIALVTAVVAVRGGGDNELAPVTRAVVTVDGTNATSQGVCTLLNDMMENLPQ